MSDVEIARPGVPRPGVWIANVPGGYEVRALCAGCGRSETERIMPPMPMDVFVYWCTEWRRRGWHGKDERYCPNCPESEVGNE